MLEILDSPKHLVAFKLSKDLTAEDVDKSTKAVAAALTNQERINIFTEIEGKLTFTLEGLWKDLVNSVSSFGIHRKIYRAAVVSESDIYSFLIRLEGIIFSSIEMRVFTPEQRDEAFQWASKEPEPLPKAEEPKRAIHFLQTSNENVFAYEIDGRVTEKDIQETVGELKKMFENKEKINVLVRMKNFSGFDLMTLLNDDLYRVKYQSLSHVDRYAVVGAPTWMRNLLELIDPAFTLKIKVFDTEDEQAAWDWVGASQTLLAAS